MVLVTGRQCLWRLSTRASFAIPSEFPLVDLPMDKATPIDIQSLRTRRATTKVGRLEADFAGLPGARASRMRLALGEKDL